jgi:alpha-1,3-fucosyltransferase
MSIDDLPKTRYSHQLYVFYLMESPMYTGDDLLNRIPKSFFNLTMTYRVDSDIVVPYGSMVIKSSTNDNGYSWDDVLQAVKRKKKLAFAVNKISKLNISFTFI